MNIVFIVIALVMIWTSCDVEWVVSYATSIAQLSVWITAISLINFWSFWIDLKTGSDASLYLSLSPNSHVSWSSMIK